jgi:hypothetical protein
MFVADQCYDFAVNCPHTYNTKSDKFTQPQWFHFSILNVRRPLHLKMNKGNKTHNQPQMCMGLTGAWYAFTTNSHHSPVLPTFTKQLLFFKCMYERWSLQFSSELWHDVKPLHPDLESAIRIIPYFLEYPAHFFSKNCDKKLGCVAYSWIMKLVKTRLHQDKPGTTTSIRALVWMRLNTSHGQCPTIETFTFPPTCQTKPANCRVRMYVSWWDQHVCVLWKWVKRACVYDLPWLVKNQE